MIAALALMLAQATAPAAAPPPVVAAVPVQALAFAEAFVPTEATTADAVAAFRTEAARSMAQDNAMLAQLEAKYPGARQKIVDAGAVALERNYRSGLPDLHRNLAAAAAGALSIADLQAVTAFLTSPAGLATQSAVRNNIDTAKLADQAAQGGKFTSEQMLGAIDIAKSVGALTPEQTAALVRFGASPAGQRFNQARPKLQEVVVEQVNRLIESNGVAVQATIMQTIGSLSAPGKGK